MSADGTSSNGLSPREREVAALIAAGKTIAEVAQALTISPLTAEQHVRHIVDKLGIGRRSQSAAWWAEQGWEEL
jgi:non-specific serine/threonine protein kinase